MENLDVKIILAKRLRELTEEKRDLDYKMSDKKQAQLMGISYNTFRNYLKGKSDCSASNLKLMSKFYHVTTDYLLGITDIQTTDTDLQAISKYTGLSEKSVIALGDYNDNFKQSENSGVINCIDRIFSSPDFYQILINCNNIDVCSKDIPTFSDYDIIEISKKLQIDLSFLQTKIYNYGFERGREHPNIFKYDNIACMNKINDMFDNSPDISFYTKEDLIKLFDISEEELENYPIK